MAWGRKKSGRRKEPQFGLAASLSELRLGPQDRVASGGGEPNALFANLNNTATMTAYYADLTLFFQKAGAFTAQRVVLHVERSKQSLDESHSVTLSRLHTERQICSPVVGRHASLLVLADRGGIRGRLELGTVWQRRRA